MAIDHGLRRDRLSLDGAAGDAGCGCEGRARFAGELGEELDERTIHYVLQTRPHFEELRQAVGQFAGMLVLAAAGAKSIAQDHPLFATARDALARATDGIRSTRASARAAHHHRHLLGAAEALGVALIRAKEDVHLHGIERERIDPMLEPLRVAYQHLARAAKALPGFEIVSFDQACCAPRHLATRC